MEKKMKAKSFLLMLVLFLTGTTLILMTGCEYDVAEPQWYESEFTEPQLAPKINSIDPSAVVPGVNIVTIRGEYLNSVPDGRIYLEMPGPVVTTPDIIEKTSSYITIRRPNLITDSCRVKLVPDTGLVIKSPPFLIDPVIEEYGSFLESVELGGIAADNAQNIYVAYANSATSNIYKITPAGDKSVLQISTRLPSGITLGSDGWLYVFSTNRLIERVHTETGEKAEWHRLKTSRQIKTGALDANGYLYVAGYKTDLWVIRPDSTSDASTLYPTSGADSLHSLKVYGPAGNQFLYIAGGSPAGHFIWKHAINNDGTLGLQEVVTNLGTYASSVVRDFAIASDGRIFIATDGPNSMLVFNPADGSLDLFYKDIIRPYSRFMRWGNANYVYLINGSTNTDPALAETWAVYKVDMGINGAN